MVFQHPVKKKVVISSAQVSSSTLFVCDYCNRGFQRKDNLITHMQTHGFMKKQFECKVCRKSFAHRYNLKVHIMLHQSKNAHQLEMSENSQNEVRYHNVLWFSSFTIYLPISSFSTCIIVIRVLEAEPKDVKEERQEKYCTENANDKN